MARESPALLHIAELDIPEHFLPVDPLTDPCYRQSVEDEGGWCYKRSLVAELSTMLDLDEDVVVDMTMLRDRISQCERWEKALKDRLGQELKKRRDMLAKGDGIIEAATREVCLALAAAVNSRRALRGLVEERVLSPSRTLALARRRHRLILVKRRLIEVSRVSQAYKAYRVASSITDSIHAALELHQLLDTGIELPSWMKEEEGSDLAHPSVLLASIRSTLCERLKPLAIVDDLSDVREGYVETLSGYWQLIMSYNDAVSTNINPAADMCSNFCNLVVTIARQCLLAATNRGGRDMDEYAYTGRKAMPVTELCQLLDPRELAHFLHRLLEVFLTLIIRYDRLVEWHERFDGCDGMEDSQLIEFVNNLSAELTARRELILERVYKQLQVLLESLNCLISCPLRTVSDICGLIRVFNHASMAVGDVSGPAVEILDRLVRSVVRDVSLRIWDGDLLPLAQRESWRLLESSDPLIPLPKRVRVLPVEAGDANVLSKPSIEAAIYDLSDLSGVSSMISPRWPMVTQATANRIGDLLQLGVVHPPVQFDIIIAITQVFELYLHTIFGLFVVRHPTFDEIVSGGHNIRADINDRHAIYEDHDKFIAYRHYSTLSRQFFKLRQLVAASGSRFHQLLLVDVPTVQKLGISSSSFGLKERCSALQSCEGLLVSLRYHWDNSEIVEEMQERQDQEFLSTCSTMVCELRLVVLDNCAGSIVNKPLAAWTQRALRRFAATGIASSGQSSPDEERKGVQDNNSNEADTLVSSLYTVLADAREGVDPSMLRLLAACMYKRVAQQAGEITGLVRPVDTVISEGLQEYLSNISASLVLPEGDADTYWEARLTGAWKPVLEYAKAFRLREGQEA
ncbi:hypothetical protein FOZ61_002049 [Perkinsus olseni]|uniref:Uncharacterized protein n=1 Tax=Perkinsus olseni TaxID=32597 RepID=A0A7J6LUI1_PEROL|nr:hypothetical protein FOZ61_002049 [Perkinsus olseni]